MHAIANMFLITIITVVVIVIIRLPFKTTMLPGYRLISVVAALQLPHPGQ